ncbi:hypothetical protein RQP46_008624 [Phenoliferia psychrophenolica]
MDEPVFTFTTSYESGPPGMGSSTTIPGLTFPGDISRLGGSWTLKSRDDDANVSCEVGWWIKDSNEPVNVDVTFEIKSPADAAGRGTKTRSTTSYRISATFSLRPKHWEQRQLDAWVEDVIDSPNAINVTFIFPDNRTLHGNSTFLALNSPYFKTLFSSEGFSESSNNEKAITPPVNPTINKKRPFPDSDDEADAPISAPAHHSSYLYRLADYLELPVLQELALVNIMSQIMPSNAVQELFSDLTALYEPLQVALLDYAVDYWVDIRQGEGWKDLVRRIETEDDVPIATTRLFAKLLSRLST